MSLMQVVTSKVGSIWLLHLDMDFRGLISGGFCIKYVSGKHNMVILGLGVFSYYSRVAISDSSLYPKQPKPKKKEI